LDLAENDVDFIHIMVHISWQVLCLYAP